MMLKLTVVLAVIASALGFNLQMKSGETAFVFVTTYSVVMKYAMLQLSNPLPMNLPSAISSP